MIRQALRTWRPPPWLIRSLPGTSRCFGPPRHMCAGGQLRGGVRSLDLHVDISLANPTHLNTVDNYWISPTWSPVPVAPYVLAAGHARLLAPGAWVVGDRDTFVWDTSFWGHRDLATARHWHDIFLRRKPRPVHQLAGRVLSLASDFAPYSYGHWLIDSLPRWLLVERAGLGPADFDTIYLPGPDTPSTRRLLTALGLPAEKLVRTPPEVDFEVENLTATSFPGAAGSASSLARAMAVRLQPPRAPFRRLYLSRDGHRRNFRNHDELLPVFAEFGFEVCSPATDPDIVAKCAEARVIVGIEGSQCFNALFAPSDGALVVIAPDGFRPLPYVQSIAAASGLSLYLLGARVVDADSNCILPPKDLREGLRRVVDIHR